MTMTDRSTVVGVFTDRVQAERAIEALHRADFTDEQVGFVRRGEDTGSTQANVNNPPIAVGTYGPTTATAGATGFSMTSGSGYYDSAMPQRPYNPNTAQSNQGNYDPTNASTGASSPDAAPGRNDPTTSEKPYTPNVAPDTFDPTAPGGGVNPNAAPGTFDPTAPEGPYSTNTAPDANDPTRNVNANNAPGTFDPNAPERPYNPNVAPDMYDPTADDTQKPPQG